MREKRKEIEFKNQDAKENFMKIIDSIRLNYDKLQVIVIANFYNKYSHNIDYLILIFLIKFV